MEKAASLPLSPRTLTSNHHLASLTWSMHGPLSLRTADLSTPLSPTCSNTVFPSWKQPRHRLSCPCNSRPSVTAGPWGSACSVLLPSARSLHPHAHPGPRPAFSPGVPLACYLSPTSSWDPVHLWPSPSQPVFLKKKLNASHPAPAPSHPASTPHGFPWHAHAVSLSCSCPRDPVCCIPLPPSLRLSLPSLRLSLGSDFTCVPSVGPCLAPHLLDDSHQGPLLILLQAKRPLHSLREPVRSVRAPSALLRLLYRGLSSCPSDGPLGPTGLRAVSGLLAPINPVTRPRPVMLPVSNNHWPSPQTLPLRS